MLYSTETGLSIADGQSFARVSCHGSVTDMTSKMVELIPRGVRESIPPMVDTIPVGHEEIERAAVAKGTSANGSEDLYSVQSRGISSQGKLRFEGDETRDTFTVILLCRPSASI